MRSAYPSIGSMRDQVTIQSGTETTAANGEKTTVWVDGATVYARVRETGGSETVAERQVQAEVLLEVWIRYRADVVAKGRITFGGAPLDVESVTNPDGIKRFSLLLCKKKGV